jgi:RES domain-containing protein
MAVLETIVHYGDFRLVRDLCVLVSMEVPDASPARDGAALPVGWDRFPHLDITQELGSAWAVKGESLALRVPSAIVRGSNILVNPNHASFAAAVQTTSLPETIPFGGH